MFTRHPDGTIEIKLNLSWQEIDAELKKQTDLAVSQAEMPGFRKGKAPRQTVEPKLDKSQLLSQSLSQLLPKIYTQIVDANKIKPILYPQIRIDKGKWGEDFEFTAITCESPVVKLPEKFAEKLQLLEPKDAKNPLPDILEYLNKNSQVQIPAPLIEEESNHRLTHLVENLTQLGMDMSKYLTTKKITTEDLKAQTSQGAKSDLEMEFILNSIQIIQKLTDRQSVLDYLKSLPKT